MPGISGQGEIATAKCSSRELQQWLFIRAIKWGSEYLKPKSNQKKKNAGANNESKLETSDSLSNFVTHRNPKGFLEFFL